MQALALSLALSALGVWADAAPSHAGVGVDEDRPPECPAAGTGRRRRVTVWQRARFPQREAYCDRIAQAESALVEDARRATALADEAEKIWPGRATTEVVRARAELALGDAASAVETFERAEAKDPAAIRGTRASADHAFALVRVHRVADADARFRGVVPRADRLSRDERALVLLRAAHARMTHVGVARVEPATREAALAAATAYLEEGRRDPAATWAPELTLSLALVVARSGDPLRAESLAREARAMGAGSTRAPSFVADPADTHALTALSASDASVARAAWESYLRDVGEGRYAAHARAAVAASTPAAKTKPKRPSSARGGR